MTLKAQDGQETAIHPRGLRKGRRPGSTFSPGRPGHTLTSRTTGHKTCVVRRVFKKVPLMTIKSMVFVRAVIENGCSDPLKCAEIADSTGLPL